MCGANENVCGCFRLVAAVKEAPGAATSQRVIYQADSRYITSNKRNRSRQVKCAPSGCRRCRNQRCIHLQLVSYSIYTGHLMSSTPGNAPYRQAIFYDLLHRVFEPLYAPILLSLKGYLTTSSFLMTIFFFFLVATCSTHTSFV